MSATFVRAMTADSGWRPHDPQTAPDFRADGRDLVVELRRWHKGDIGALTPPPNLNEEVGAVLDGRFELLCGDERHELAAGSGILIPPGEDRTWRLLSESGVLYRVFPREPQ
jgi:hypothetical protein